MLAPPCNKSDGVSVYVNQEIWILEGGIDVMRRHEEQPRRSGRRSLQPISIVTISIVTS